MLPCGQAQSQAHIWLTLLQLWLHRPCVQRMGHFLVQSEQSSSLGWQDFEHRWLHRRERPQGCLQGMC